MNYSGPVVCSQARKKLLITHCSCVLYMHDAHELVKSRKFFRLSTGNMKMIQQENFIQLVIAPMNAECRGFILAFLELEYIQPCSIDRKMVVKCWSSLLSYYISNI
jgi:hypothetical protein